MSPAALEGYLAFDGALSRGAIDAPTRERIALAIANVNGCTCCNSAHGYLAEHVAGLSAEERAANRAGGSTDPRAAAAVRFAVQVAENRGRIDPAALTALRDAGFDDAAALEIVGLVAVNVFTNYVNEAFGTEVDFPVVPARRAA